MLLCRPLTMMNHSGIAVANLLSSHHVEIERMVVLHDDLDIPLGQLRIKVGGGHGGHKGLISIIKELGRSDFIRLRLGIGVEPKPSDTTAYVLEPFSEKEMSVLMQVLPAAVEAALDLVHNEPALVMNRVNRRLQREGLAGEGNQPPAGICSTSDEYG